MQKICISALIAWTVILGTAVAVQAAVTNSRAAAIHECSAAVQRYPETTFSSLEFEQYRACMAQHGQVE